MRVMILDDDPWIADLLKQVVLSVRPVAQVECFSDVSSALAAWHQNDYHLVMADWNLPDAPGVEMLRIIRQKDQHTPLIIITARADRDSVLVAKPLGISAFFTKPFQIPRLVQCLESLLPPDERVREPVIIAEDLIHYLNRLSPAELDLPFFTSVDETLKLGSCECLPNLSELAENWQNDPAITAYLIAAANSPAYLGQGQICTTLNSSLARLGSLTSLNLVSSQALQQKEVQPEGMLTSLLQAHLDAADKLAQRVLLIAEQCGLDPAPLCTAALLHRMGELCVIYQIQKWESMGNATSEETLSHAIRDFSAPFANYLKARLGIPKSLRELIGATYALPAMQVRREQVVMRLADAIGNGESEASIQRLKRLAGLI